MGRFELFDHTADIGFRSYGSDLNDVFANAAKALFEVITNIESIEPTGEVKISVEGSDIEDLLTRWLSELLLLIDTKSALLSEFDISIDEANISLTASARGETFDPDKHEYKTEIKAVTHHMLSIKRNDDPVSKERFVAQVLLDI